MIEAEYNGFKGIAYGQSSYIVQNKNGKEIFHTGFLRDKIETKEQCLEQLKSVLELLETLNHVDIDEWNDDAEDI